MDTMRFTTELLPLVTGQPGVTVEVTGEAADYREAGDSLRIGVSAGAPSAMQFALRHRDRCSALVLAVPLAYPPKHVQAGPPSKLFQTVLTAIAS